MKVSTGYKYIKKYLYTGIKNVKNIISSPQVTEPELNNIGNDFLAERNRLMILKQSENYIEPFKSEFRCTKDMLKYAKSRCMYGIKQGYEHAIIMDIKSNKIIAEFKGDANKCSIKAIKNLNLDKENTVIMHGHVENFPLSTADVSIIDSCRISQVIAIDANGEFSLVEKTQDYQPKEFKKAFYDYSENSYDDRQIYNRTQNKEEFKRLTDDTLKHHAPKMGLRYVTNYGYLRAQKMN